MDETILASAGGYNGRDDFIREAVADRIAEDRARPSGGPSPMILLRAAPKGGEVPKRGEITKSEPKPVIGAGIDGVATFQPHRIGGEMYGLHNRDYPTLWASSSLLQIVRTRGAPIPWSEFLSGVIEAAWQVGAHLSKLDSERSGDELKASIGFPINVDKRQSSEARFVEHMVGVPHRGGQPKGPLFAMQLAASENVGGNILVAPTPSACELWTALAKAGYAQRENPPYPKAWTVFREHLRAALPSDYEAWVRVLHVVANGPTRDELVRPFLARWSGAAAATNVAGYVSRGREWGLVEPKLLDGRYALTALGVNEVKEAEG